MERARVAGGAQRTRVLYGSRAELSELRTQAWRPCALDRKGRHRGHFERLYEGFLADATAGLTPCVSPGRRADRLPWGRKGARGPRTRKVLSAPLFGCPETEDTISYHIEKDSGMLTR